MDDDASSNGGTDTLSLSFLDVLSCGLGAAIFLFLIFAVMPHLGGGAGMQASAATSAAGKGQSIGFKSLRELVENASVEVEITLTPVSGNLQVPDDPWDHSLPSRAENFTSSQLDQHAITIIAAIDTGRSIEHPIRAVLPEKQWDTIDGGKMSVLIMVGGTFFERSFEISKERLGSSGGELLRLDLSLPEDKWLSSEQKVIP